MNRVSKSARRNMSVAHTGVSLSKYHRNCISESLQGHSVSDSTKHKISEKAKGRKFTEQHKLRISKSRKGRPSNFKGKKHSDKSRVKLSKIQGGNGDLIRLNNRRWSPKDVEWRYAIFKRDNFTCQFCLKYGGKLHAHHIRPCAAFPKLRYKLSNGITLCEKCHRKVRGYEAEYARLFLGYLELN